MVVIYVVALATANFKPRAREIVKNGRAHRNFGNGHSGLTLGEISKEHHKNQA
jgi:hypothetical protein